MRAPFEQYGLYLTALGGSAYMANSFFRAHNIAKYVKYKDLPGHQEEAMWAAAMSKAAPHELEDRALFTIARLRTKGLGVAVALPTVWLA